MLFEFKVEDDATGVEAIRKYEGELIGENVVHTAGGMFVAYDPAKMKTHEYHDVHEVIDVVDWPTYAEAANAVGETPIDDRTDI